MIITIPHILRRSHITFMLIEGGRNTDQIPTKSFVTNFAVSVGSVAIELRQIPNEPIRFMTDPTQKSRTKDAIIAWTWITFIEQNGTNPNILLQMPMTKRGWITWTTAAVNNQLVSAAVPVVINILNLQKAKYDASLSSMYKKRSCLVKMFEHSISSHWLDGHSHSVITTPRTLLDILIIHISRKWLPLLILMAQNSTSITFSYTAPMPPSGYWNGMSIQIKFPGPENTTLYLTTETLILPNTFPADPCTGDD
ncbi:unnamed protein product [Rotaria sp. Silwood2]|nr:unnamed protein product [Rotaria sp. Silwood2]